MKKIIMIILVIILNLSACATPKYELNADCGKMSCDDLFKSITTLLLQEGFTIQSDSKLGYLQATKMRSCNIGTHSSIYNIWIFQYINNHLIAYAKSEYSGQSASTLIITTDEKYYNDKVNKDFAWYWNVRNGLEKLCSKIEIIEIKE